MHLGEQLFDTRLVLLSRTPYHVRSKSVNQLVRTSHLAAINLQTTHTQEALHQARTLISPIKQRADHAHLFSRMCEEDLLKQILCQQISYCRYGVKKICCGLMRLQLKGITVLHFTSQQYLQIVASTTELLMGAVAGIHLYE